MTELYLPQERHDDVGLTAGELLARPILELASDRVLWRHKYGNATGWGEDNIAEAYLAFLTRVAAHFSELTRDRRRLDGRLKSLCEFAGLTPEQRDLHPVVFSAGAGRLVTPQALALLACEEEGLNVKGLRLVVLHEWLSDPILDRPGVFYTPDAGGTLNVLALVAEGDAPPHADAEFDVWAAPVASRLLERRGVETDAEMVARLLAEMLGDISKAAHLLDADGEVEAARLLLELPVTADQLRYGGPVAQRPAPRTDMTLWPGEVGEIHAVLRRAGRRYALAFGPALAATRNPGHRGVVSSARLRYERTNQRMVEGVQLLRMLWALGEEDEADVGAGRRRRRIEKTLGVVTVSEARLRDLGMVGADWMVLDGVLKVGFVAHGGAVDTKVMMRQRGSDLTAYAFSGRVQDMLQVAHRSFREGMEQTLGACVITRYQQRVGGYFVIKAGVKEHLRDGVEAALNTANLLYIAVALRPVRPRA